MPIFIARNSIQIQRDMIARVVSRSNLSGLTDNNVFFHVVAAASDEDAEQYFQMARLQELFSIDRATGSDLDERAREIVPNNTSRRGSITASGSVIFSRPTTTGTVTIPAGTVVSATDADGIIRYRTLVSVNIDAGLTASNPTSIVALEGGIRSNVGPGAINVLTSSIPGVSAVTNVGALTNGRDRESDDRFRARKKALVQAISRGTPTAIRGFALNVQLSDGRAVLFARVVEPITPTGVVEVLIDDGSGTPVGGVNDIDETFAEGVGPAETVLNPAAGGERDVFTQNKPWALGADPGSTPAVFVNAVQIPDTDYEFNEALGQVTFDTALTAGDIVTINYSFYTGLIAATQQVIDGDPLDPVSFPGVRAGGIKAVVVGAGVLNIEMTVRVVVDRGFSVANVQDQVETAIVEYINNLDIGEHVIIAEICSRAMAISGVTDFRILTIGGSGPAASQNIIILPTFVARVSSDSAIEIS